MNGARCAIGCRTATTTNRRPLRRSLYTLPWRHDRVSVPFFPVSVTLRHHKRAGFRHPYLQSAADPPISPPDAGDSNDEAAIYTPEVFPRIRETDPYRVLGLTIEATFEEIQDARNYYYETYRAHEASREKVEWAFDRVLSEHMEKRKKFGFRAAKLGAKQWGPKDDVPPKSLFQRVREVFEVSVPLTTIVNDGVIYLLLSFWAAGTQYAAGDPSGPFVVTIGFCCWRLFDKRQKRTPDGPFFGGSPIWGALATSVLSFFIGTVICFSLTKIIPAPESFPIDALGACLSILSIGFVSIFVK